VTQTRQRVCELQMDSILKTLARKPRLPIQFTAQYGDDVFLWELFGGQTEGFFVEAGAFDGYHYSTTYALEAYGWSGLCVEPLPAAYAACVRRRPNSRVVHAAFGFADGEIELTATDDSFGGMLSHTVATPWAAELIREHRKHKVRVPLATLNTLLKDHAGAIDVVALDAEGAEPDILRGFDLERFKPRVLVIESNDRAAVAALLGGSYRHVANFEGSAVYVRCDESAMFEWLRWNA